MFVDAGELGDPVDRRAEREREPLGPLEGEPLGRELAEHQGQVRDRQRHQHQRDHVRGPGRETEGDQSRGQLAGQGRATEGGGQEPGQRDADLDGGEEAVGVLGQARDGRTALAAVGQRPDLALAQGHQGDLGRREEAADEDEDDDKPDVRERAVHCLWLSSMQRG
jgi:hypothetical protein